ncbi:MAG: MinD/ParA family protein [Planctomycetota bacterium]|nr:MinD/ParA family protein [Planctomycetota bacterium]
MTTPGKQSRNAPQTTAQKTATVIAVTSGKGGVGKTSLSVNLANEFSHRGYRTMVVDTDLGLANTHILAGIRPTRTLCDYIEGKADLASIIEDGPANVKFISGGSGIQEMANIGETGRDRILSAIEELKPFCDVVIIDTGAGVSKSVTDFVAMADHTIVVTTSNFAAIADAYGIIKVVVSNGYQKPVHCVVNRVRSPEEADQVFTKLKSCTERFLGFDLNWLGLLPEDNSVEGAVTKRIPFNEAFPGSVASRYLAKLVTGLTPHVGARPRSPQGAAT